MAKKNKLKMSESQAQRFHRRRSRQAIGAAALLFIVVGVATLLVGIGFGVHAIFDDSKEKATYEKLLTPLVILDPLPFEGVENASQQMLWEAALWACVYNEDTSAYERDELGALLLPKIHVDTNASNLYGPDFQVPAETFTNSGMEFIYNAEKKAFVMPITGQVSSYTPKVVKIKGITEKVITVGYISPYAGMPDANGKKVTDQPVKYVDYVLKRVNGEYYLVAVRESSMKPEISTSDSSSSSPVSNPSEEPQAALEQQAAEQQQAAG